MSDLDIYTRRLARGGYITYARAGAPGNAACSYPGHGATPEESIVAAQYWANQNPWVVTVPVSRAPKWAVEGAR